jgi:hypothetical protein
MFNERASLAVMATRRQGESASTGRRRSATRQRFDTYLLAESSTTHPFAILAWRGREDLLANRRPPAPTDLIPAASSPPLNAGILLVALGAVRVVASGAGRGFDTTGRDRADGDTREFDQVHRPASSSPGDLRASVIMPPGNGTNG